jgi:uncharacterized membrane protein YdjX (TVP38/TMEM64 family)
MHKKHRLIKYPKMLLFFISVLFAFFLFYGGENFAPFNIFLLSLGYFGVFIAGIFYSYGFTAAPATAILLVLAKEQNFLLAGIIGGLGALLSDIFIFLFVRYSFLDEIKRFGRSKVAKFIRKEEKIIFGHYKKYVLPVFAGFLIASPLPTEIGVTLMASLKKMSVKKFIFIAYILHTLGIFAILLIGNII